MNPVINRFGLNNEITPAQMMAEIPPLAMVGKIFIFVDFIYRNILTVDQFFSIIYYIISLTDPLNERHIKLN